MGRTKTFLATLLFLMNAFTVKVCAQKFYHEPYRPQVHFSPKEKWTNDPNGMVFYEGVYHLFFQYYPDSTVWGPMHWGHATSRDLIHWQQQPIALYPDSLGYIFSGSAVVDYHNTSGLSKNGQVPLVAVYTSHNPNGEKQHKNNYQNESIAYSLNGGKTWVKFPGNPVLKNPGIADFRDPKVMWYSPGKKWIMTLATKDRITFYSSLDLKTWKRESDFGKDVGAHGGVWECPDLFTLDDNGKKVWVLIVNLNPGGPNKGSATQYFLGNFDGNKFQAIGTETKWLDYGPDEYAGITWSNTGNRKIFLGWMSNWVYANLVPTARWRNAMTIPRELHIKHVGTEMFVTSEPVLELNKIQEKPATAENVAVTNQFDLSTLVKKDITIPCRLNLKMATVEDFSIVLSNDLDEKLIIGYNKELNQFFIDRTSSGNVGLQKDFAAKHTAPRLAKSSAIGLSLILDESSAELFADKGLSVMTEIFFPGKPYNRIKIETGKSVVFQKIQYIGMEGIWP